MASSRGKAFRSLIGQEVRVTIRYEGFAQPAELMGVLTKDSSTQGYHLRDRIMALPVSYVRSVDIDSRHIHLEFDNDSRFRVAPYWRDLVASMQPTGQLPRRRVE